MPARELMRWCLQQKLWRKYYGGTRYHISCRQLSDWIGKPVPNTKAESYQVANAWWLAKRAEIDGQKPPHRFRDWLDSLAQRRQIALERGQQAVASGLAREIQSIEKGELPSFLPEDWDSIVPHSMDGVEEPEGPPRPSDEELQRLADQEELRQALDPSSEAWTERTRIANERAELIPEDRTVAFQVRRYLANEEIREKAGKLSAGELDTARRCLKYLQGWIGPDSPIESLNSEAVDKYFHHLLTCEISDGYKTKRLRFARSFIEELALRGLIQRPLNLRHPRHRFGSPAKAIKTLEAKDAKALVSHAEGPLRLYILLMANCGFTQVDCSDLRRSEIDFRAGRITRKRSKTKDEENVPTVSYRLWPDTLALLREYSEPTGEFALLTDTKERLVRSYTKADGKRYKYDAIRKPFKRLAKNLKGRKILHFEPTPKIFRKTSASLLKKHAVYQNFDQVFLGHVPTTTADIHYSATANELFDEAVCWLGQQYGFLPKSE